MNVFIQGDSKPYQVGKKEFIASGGEGDIYLKNNIAFKIYHSQNNLLPFGKIQELNELIHPQIIKPESPLLDNSGKYIGYTMKGIKNTLPLSRLFTNDFRKKNNITNEIALEIARQIIEITHHIHDKQCLMVDANEMNYLVSDDFKKVYFIDVDSYQTPNYSATAYSDSTLDPLVKNNQFNTYSDWFAVGVVLCNLFIGIHPFKGRYKGTQHQFKKGQFTERMKKQVSVFNQDVSVNSAVRDFSLLPKKLHEWLFLMFEKGERTPPPEQWGHVHETIDYQSIMTSGESIDFEIIKEFDEFINDIFYFNGEKCVKTNKHFIYKDKKTPYSKPSTLCLYTPKKLKPLLLKLENEQLFYYDVIEKQKHSTPIYGQNIFIKDNKAYVINDNKIELLKIIENNQKINFTVEQFYTINTNSTSSMDNTLYMELPQKKHVIVPHEASFYSFDIGFLNFNKIINAQSISNLLTLVYFKNGNYYKISFLIDFNKQTLKEIYHDKTEDLIINQTALDKGLLAFVSKDYNLHILHKDDNKDIPTVKIIKDDQIKINNKLLSNINQMHLIIEQKEIKISLKK